jgi:hypothetical protein
MKETMRKSGEKTEDTDSLFSNSQNLKNLFGVSLTWSLAGFCVYLLTYYSSQFAGNFYINFSMFSFTNVFTIGWATLISKKFKLVRVVQILLILIILLCGIVIALDEALSEKTKQIVIPIVLVILYLQCSTLQNYGYHAISALFPVKVKGQAYGYVNFVTRPFSALAPILS